MFIQKGNRSRIAKIIMKQNNGVEEVTLSDVRAYYIPTVIKTVGINRERDI